VDPLVDVARLLSYMEGSPVETASILALALGFFFFTFPPVELTLRRFAKLEDTTARVVVWVILYIILVVVAGLIIALANRYPYILLPLAGLTCVFRIISPPILVTELKDKFEGGAAWSVLSIILTLVSIALLALGIKNIIVYFYEDTLIEFGLIEAQGKGVSFESTVMSLSVAYLYVRIYLQAFMARMKESDFVITWLAGIFIGISFAILIPLVLSEYSLYYALAGAVGWTIAIITLVRDRRDRKDTTIRI